MITSELIGLSTITPSNFSFADSWINSFSILRIGRFCCIRACLGNEERNIAFVFTDINGHFILFAPGYNQLNIAI